MNSMNLVWWCLFWSVSPNWMARQQKVDVSIDKLSMNKRRSPSSVLSGQKSLEGEAFFSWLTLKEERGNDNNGHGGSSHLYMPWKKHFDIQYLINISTLPGSRTPCVMHLAIFVWTRVRLVPNMRVIFLLRTSSFTNSSWSWKIIDSFLF